jgi:hypothetical protein
MANILPKRSHNILKAFKNKLWVVILFVSLFFIALTIFFLTAAHTGAATLVGALLGIWLAWLLNKSYSDQRREDEYRSLLISFVHELEEDYHRCVLYYKQRLERNISFSALFDFNDASTLSRLASVTDNPKIVDAIMFLKKQYFQVGRHVENASRLATEYEQRMMEIRRRVSSEKFELFDIDNPQTWRYLGLVEGKDLAWEARKFKDEAHLAQATALGFFGAVYDDNITYPKIVKSTLLLLKELKEKWSAAAAKEFQSRFAKDRKELSEFENKKRGSKKQGGAKEKGGTNETPRRV